MTRSTCAACLVALTLLSPLAAGPARDDAPRSPDARLQITQFAGAPDVVHPVGVAFDKKGRLLVVESHTHFRPAGYKGPKHDRIRLAEDTDGDGKADKFTTFYEGTTATMAIAVHPGGSVYIATRNEILRLRDTKGDGKADEVRRIAFLETKAGYPHNGLSGLCFDSRGDLYFGMGENEGLAYKLVGSDGSSVTGGGEGGNLLHCTADGKQLRRVATGFWNPFGVCTDIFGRVFAVDNDPDAMPPCRLLHIVENGDYGYQYRYGRSGRHPFQSWDGQLAGTLPMVCGVGEAPCQVLSYESDGLPAEYRGDLLVASWADHRIERYALKERGASVSAERKPFIQGGADFRPVGVAVAPDGSLFVSDWVRSDYTLHGQGAIWHVRQRNAAPPARPTDPVKALASAHRPLREEAARKLAAEPGRKVLHDGLRNADVRIRAACLTALIDAKDDHLDLKAFADREAVVPLQARAVAALPDARLYLDAKQPAAVRFEAIRSLWQRKDQPDLVARLSDPDPFLRHVAVQTLGSGTTKLYVARPTNRAEKLGILLAWRALGDPAGRRHLQKFLEDDDGEVRFLAAKWVSDEKLTDFRPAIAAALKDRRLDVRGFQAFSTALARLDGRDVSEAQMADYFFARVQDRTAAAPLRVLSLQTIPTTHKKLTPDFLAGLLAEDDAALRLEAVRALVELPDAKRIALLRKTAGDAKLGSALRAEAIVGLAGQAEPVANLLALAEGDNATLRDEALRALVGTKLSADQRTALQVVGVGDPAVVPLVARVLSRPFTGKRPPVADTEAWLKHLAGPADAAAGRRVFFHPKLAGCYRCHRIDGRGQEVGPDLSLAGRNDRRHLVESILRPSAVVAPHYQVWQIESADGKVRTGLLMRTNLDDYTYLDAKGEQFRVDARDVVESRPLPQSLMPDGLADQLTDQELRDLLAYLEGRK